MVNGLHPQYLQIALDIALRIVNGEFPEDSQIYGRSLLASEYNVSPETIRRSLRLLADMKVVETKPQSGTTILSVDNAKRYVKNYEGVNETRNLQCKLRKMLEESAALHQDISNTISALIQGSSFFAAAHETLPNYDVSIPEGSPVIGQSIGALKFWQNTGATIVAIRRNQNVILSPGPYAELYSGDVIVLVGSLASIEAAQSMVAKKDE